MFTSQGETGILEGIVMNDFRNAPGRPARRAIDGVFNGPQRPLTPRRPLGNRPVLGGSPESSSKPKPAHDLRRNTAPRRPVLSTMRPASTAQPSQSKQAAPARQVAAAEAAQPAESILHMTLPGGKIHAEKQKKQSRFAKMKAKYQALSTKRKVWWWTWRSLIVLLALLFATVAFLSAKGYFKLHKVFKGGGSAPALQENVSPSLLKGEGDGRINILLLGRGGDGHDGADLTDTILLMSIDPVNNDAAMLSVPRDLWVTGSTGSSYKINATYALAKQRALYQNSKDQNAAHKAGVDAIEDMISDIVDMPIHYYAMIDFKAFEQAINTVGGIDINVPEESTVEEWLWDESTGKNYHLNVDAGMQHFDGQRALFFSRSRHTSPRGDFDRSERQRLVIQALSQKVLSAGTYANPAKISGLLSDFGDHVSTDMSISDAVRLSSIGKKVGGKITSLDIASADNPLMVTANISDQSVVLPRAGEGDYSALQAFVHSKMRDGYIAKENAVVDVLNGAGYAGLAGTQADRLKYYGYNVGTIGDAPSMYDQTIIVDLTNGKKPYTKNYLEKRYDVKVTTKLPEGVQAGNANFIVILGRNETNSSEN